MEYLETNKPKAAEAEKEGRMLKGHKRQDCGVECKHETQGEETPESQGR